MVQRHTLALLSILVMFCAFFTYADGPVSLSNPEKQTVTGEILREPFVNKKQDTIEGQHDWYLKTEDKKLFIKVCASQVDEQSLDQYTDLKVQATIVKKEGLWDDNCQSKSVQSREGTYIEVHSLQLKRP